MKITLRACLLLVAVAGCSKPPMPAKSPYAAGPVPAGIPAVTAKNMRNMPPEFRERLLNPSAGRR